MMSNYSRTTELISAANNSAGASQEQFNKTLEGLDAKLEQLKAAWQEFVMGLANNDAIKAVVDLLTGLLNTLNSLVNGLSGSSGISKAISSFFVAFSTFKLGGAIFGKTPVGEKVTSRIGALVGITPDSAKAAGLETSRSFGLAFKDGLSKFKGINKNTFKDFLGIGKTKVSQMVKQDAFSTGTFKESVDKQIATYRKGIANAQKAINSVESGNGAMSWTLNSDYYKKQKERLVTLENELNNFRFHANEVFAAYEKGGMKAASKVAEQYGISLDTTVKKVEGFKEKTTVSLQTVTMSAMALGVAFNGLASLGEKMGWSEDVNTALRTIGNTLMSLTFILPIITKAFQKFGVDVTVTFLNIPIIGWIAAAIAGFTVLITLFNKWAKDNSAEEKLKRAKEAADEAAEAADNAKESYENLKTSLDELGDKYENLEQLTKGTQEWKDAIQQTNTAALELIGSYGELAQYAHWENGVLTIDTDSSEVQDILNQRSSTAKTTQAVSSIEQTDLLKSQMGITFSDYKVKASSDEQDEIIRKIINGSITNGQQLAEELGQKEDVSINNLFNSLQKLAFQIDIYTQSVNQSAMDLIDTKDYSEEEKNMLGEFINSKGYQALRDRAETESQFGKYTRDMDESTQVAYVAAAKEYFNESAHLGKNNKIIYTDDEGNEQTVDFIETFYDIQASKDAATAMENFTKAIRNSSKEIQDVFLTQKGNLTKGQLKNFDEIANKLQNFISSEEESIDKIDETENPELSQLAQIWLQMGASAQATFGSDFKNFVQEYLNNLQVSEDNLTKASTQLSEVGLTVKSLDVENVGGETLEKYGKKLQEIIGDVGISGIENINNALNTFLTAIDESDIPIVMDYINAMDFKSLDAWYDLGESLEGIASKSKGGKVGLDNFINSMINFTGASKKYSLEQVGTYEDLLKEISGRKETERTFTTEQKDQIVGQDKNFEELFIQIGTDEWAYIGDSMSSLEEAIRKNTKAILSSIEDKGDYEKNKNIDDWLKGDKEYTTTTTNKEMFYEPKEFKKTWSDFSDYIEYQYIDDEESPSESQFSTMKAFIELYNAAADPNKSTEKINGIVPADLFAPLVNRIKFITKKDGLPSFDELFEDENGHKVLKENYRSVMNAIFDTWLFNDREALNDAVMRGGPLPAGGEVDAVYYKSRPVGVQKSVSAGTSRDIMADPSKIDSMNLEQLEDVAGDLQLIGDLIDENDLRIGNEKAIRSTIKQYLKDYNADYAEEYQSAQRANTQISLGLATSGQEILNANMVGYEDDLEEAERVKEQYLTSLMQRTEGATAAYYDFINKLGKSEEELLPEERRHLKAMAIDYQKLGDEIEQLNEKAKNYQETLTEENRGTNEYRKALTDMTGEIQRLFNLEENPISYFSDPESQKLLEDAVAGEEGAWEKLRDYIVNTIIWGNDESIQGSLDELTKYIKELDPSIEISTELDPTGILQTMGLLQDLKGQAYMTQEAMDKLKATFSAYGFTIDWDISWDKKYLTHWHYMGGDAETFTDRNVSGETGVVSSTPVYFPKGLSSVATAQNTKSIFDPDELTKSGNGDSEKTDTWENPYDKLYNKVQKLNEQLRIREKLERDYQRLLENSTKTSSDVIQNLWDQVAATEKVYELQEDMLKSRRQQAEEYMAENSDMLKYGYLEFDEEGNVHRRIQYDVIDAVTDPEQGEAIEKFINQLEEFADQMDEASDGMEDALDDRLELYKLGEDEYFDLESQILEAIKQQRQDEIDELSAINDSINDANSKLLDSLQSSIDQYRQDRDNERTEEEIEDKQRRLAYLQQDTSGANALEILQLQDEIQQAQEDYTDTLIDQKISELQKQNDEAAEQRQEQIDILQQQLDHDEETGTLAEQVQELMSTADAKNIMELLMGADGYDSMTALGKVKWAEEFEKGFKAAMGWIAVGNSTKAELDKGLLKAGQKITFKVDGKDVTGVVQSDGSVKVGNKTYNGVHRDSNFDWVYDSSSEQAPSSASAPTPKPTQPTSPAQKEIPIGDWGVTVAQGAKFKGGATISENVRRAGFDKSHPGGFYVYQKDSADNYLIGNSKSGGYTGWVNKKYLTAYKTGGLANFTGPAWLDGTPSKPEVILNQRDSQNFLVLKDVLSALLAKNGDSTQNGGDNYYDIDISVEKLESDYDVDRVADRIKRLIYEDGQYRNVNVVNKLR